MEIDPTTLSQAQTATQRSGFAREDFLKLLTAELTHQDPLNPIDNSQFLEQLTSLQNLEATSALTDGINALARFQQFSAASSLIGMDAIGVSDEGEVVRGRVEKVVFDASTKKIRLMIGGKLVAIGNLREVVLPESLQKDAVDRAIEASDANDAESA